jgi:Domain of unknown function (DUF4032)/Lipopolysaccharide kinase (Kdo/WaaP) family
VPLRITAAITNPALLDLPWSTPLEEWPTERLVALPRGISRHVVRFVRVSGRVYAVKEVIQTLAEREYRLLRQLERLDVPSVEAVGVVSDRETDEGRPLDPCLITQHLQFSLPYRALFSGTLRPDTAQRLLDALTLLLVRLHLLGFYWGDVSLSNTLFRRDAGEFAAYLVDAETGEIHPTLSNGQRANDLEVARVNIAGELMDLAAGGLLHESLDPIETAEDIPRRYECLWRELTGAVQFAPDERYLIDERIKRLNDLGFDIAEMQILTEPGGRRLVLQPQVVDAGHHSRRLRRLTGLDVQENQARRLLNDLDTYRAAIGDGEDAEAAVAHQWLDEVFEPVVRAVPNRLRGKLEPAEIFHEILEHRWYLSERTRSDVGLWSAVNSYVDDVLAHKPDERAVVGARIGSASDDSYGLQSTAEMRIVMPDDTAELPAIRD